MEPQKVEEDNQKNRELDIFDIEPEQLEKYSKKALIKGILSTQVEYSGPLPPPKMLHQYEAAMPGSMERIVSMAEKEQAHRHAMDDKIVETEARDGLLGIISAFVISMSLIVGGIVVIIVVPSTVATVVGGVINLTGIATIAKTFIGGTRK